MYVSPFLQSDLIYERLHLTNSGSKSAKHKLKKISGKEKRFKIGMNHVISKSIISKAKGTIRAIVSEELKNIRQSLEQRLRIKLTDIQIGHFDNSEIL